MGQKAHHRREIIFLLVFLVLFTLFFVISIINLRRKMPVFGFGVDYFVEDSFIIFMSILAILKILWQIIVH